MYQAKMGLQKPNGAAVALAASGAVAQGAHHPRDDRAGRQLVIDGRGEIADRVL
jgi:hypothetical protein